MWPGAYNQVSAYAHMTFNSCVHCSLKLWRYIAGGCAGGAHHQLHCMALHCDSPVFKGTSLSSQSMLHEDFLRQTCIMSVHDCDIMMASFGCVQGVPRDGAWPQPLLHSR